MAQVSGICNGVQNTYVLTNRTKFQKPKSVFAISLRSQSKGCSSSWGLRYSEWLGNNTVRTVRVSASVGTAEKQSKGSEIVLQPIKEISGTVTLPGSKSLSNRILLLAALSEGTTVVDNLLSSDDIHYMLDALKKLGVNVEDHSAMKQAVVEGCGGLFPVAREPTGDIELFLGNAGTAMRPLTAAVTAAGGNLRWPVVQTDI